MKLFAPNNIFVSILKNHIPSDVDVIYKPSSLISKELEFNTQAIAMIPSLDLIKNRNLFVASKYAVSFDGLLSNSYFYFIEGQKKIEKIHLQGDVSINEFILSKIIFEEKYSSQIELILDTKNEKLKENNYIICGDDNFIDSRFQKGISFADDISEFLNLPYVNYIFVSQDKESLDLFQKKFSDLDIKIENSAESSLQLLNIPNDSKEFILSNLGSVYYEMTENEQDGLNELIKLVYYHGIVDDMFDVKFL
ncbi:MAG: hypothetical protein HZA74_03355 [Ignavibacteriales bacterium]|jgi:hypothetical protein|nr:hypothetical protein [Ignavibacteriales bacterium]